MTIEVLVLSSTLLGLVVAKAALLMVDLAPSLRARRNRRLPAWAAAAARR